MVMQRTIIITRADQERLEKLIEKASQTDVENRRYLEDLQAELRNATVVDSHDVPADTITMNSTVRLKDLDSDERLEYTLVYPERANAVEDRISVLAPIGTAMLGYRKGDVIEWQVPQGVVHLQVEEVLFQPEHAGRYDL